MNRYNYIQKNKIDQAKKMLSLANDMETSLELLGVMGVKNGLR
jgi:hypothetical protein